MDLEDFPVLLGLLVLLVVLENEESLVQEVLQAHQVLLESEDSQDHKDQEGIREIWVTMVKEDRRVTEDLQVCRVFLDRLAQLVNRDPQAFLVQVVKGDHQGPLDLQERKGALDCPDQ